MKWKPQIHGMQAYKPGKPIEEVKKNVRAFGSSEACFK